MKITLQDINGLASSNQVFERGLDYYKEKRVGEIRVENGYENVEIMSYVNGSMGYYHTKVEVSERGIEWCECDCIASFQYEGACKHVVAMLLKYYYEVLPGLKTGIKGERYSQGALAYYEDQIMREQDLEIGDNPVIKAKPKLIEDGSGSFELSLSVGEKKFYIVKDLYEFSENMVQGNNVSYGKKLEFIHDISVFEEDSRPIVEYVMDKTYEYLDILRQVGMYRGFSKADRKTLPLGSKAFDEFFEIVKNKIIEVSVRGDTRDVLCIEANPEVKLTVNQEDEHYEVISSLVDYIPFSFANHKYILAGDKLYCVDRAFSKDIFPLLWYMYEAKRVHGKTKLEFDETLMKRFMLSSLGKIEKHLPVVMSEEIKEAVAPEHVLIKVFLDMSDEEDIEGDIEFHYKTFSFNPYGRLSYEATEKLEHIARDTVRESRMNSILKAYNFRTHNGKIYLKDEEDIYNFLKTGLNDLMDLGEVHVTDKLKGMNIVKSPVGAIGLRIQNNMLHVALDQVNMPIEEVQSILEAYKMKSKYYRLRSGSFIDMGDRSIGDFANIIEGLGMKATDLIDGEATLPKYRALYLDQILKQSEDIEVERDKYFKQIIRDVKSVEDADYEVAKTVRANLRSYQKTGYRWLRTMANYGFGGILADDMGLGKTLQVVTLIASEKAEAVETVEMKPSLVVCPTSLTLNWESEIAKFAPDLKTLVLMGSVDERKALMDEAMNYDVVITSYELLKRDIENYDELEFRFCIADEAQYIKNANTLNAKALKMIKSEVQFALTGTPIENSLAELWSIFDFIMPGYLFTYTHFKRDFETPIVKSQDEVTTARLKKMIAPFIMRRLKKDVLKELPDKTETVIYNTMEDMQRKLYTAHLAEAKQEIEQELKTRGAGRSHIKMLALLTRLRQLCCHPALYLQDYNEGSGKLAQCMELVRDSVEAGHKILIFSQFTSMLDLIGKSLSQEGMDYFMLTGATKAEERIRLVNEFNNSEIPIFLISLKAGGTGLNLTGADVVIHYDPWWNLSSQNQATDRAYRIGQKNNVQVFQMITKDSIEEKIKELQDKKIGLTESVLQEGEAFISQMSEEEIKELFS
nr:DEAD/DEAH box helicase [uncultured Cellulosilyticum sp.]